MIETAATRAITTHLKTASSEIFIYLLPGAGLQRPR